MEEELQRLREENERLKERVRELERRLLSTRSGLREMLKRRGLRVHRKAPSERFLVPEDLSVEQKERLYRLLLRYSFRLMLREVIKFGENFEPSQLTAYCSQGAVLRHLSVLSGMGIAEQGPNARWTLKRKGVKSFGETLEWLIAQLFIREFCAEAIHSVSFKMSPPGGDFDVIAAMEGLLVYVEVKSSPPRGIEAENVMGFLKRHQFLCPNVSLFFVDTQLRMRDKMLPIFEELLLDHQGAMERLEREIFHHRHQIYLLNASRDLVHNFRVCLMDFMRHRA